MGCRDIGFVGAVGEGCGSDVGEGEEEGNAVEVAPPHTIGGEGCGDEWADRTTHAVGAVKETESGSGIREANTEDVVEGEADGHAETEEEEGDYNDGEGGRAEKGHIGEGEEGERELVCACAAEAGLDGVGEGGSGDEADGVGDEDKGNDGVVDGVGGLQVGDQGAGSTVIDAIGEVHEGGACHAVFVHGRVGEGLEEVHAAGRSGRGRGAALDVVGRDIAGGGQGCRGGWTDVIEFEF